MNCSNPNSNQTVPLRVGNLLPTRSLSSNQAVRNKLRTLRDAVIPDRKVSAWRTSAGLKAPLQFEHYSCAGLWSMAILSFLMSAGDSFGRSMVSVSLSSLPVNLNGTL